MGRCLARSNARPRRLDLVPAFACDPDDITEARAATEAVDPLAQPRCPALSPRGREAELVKKSDGSCRSSAGPPWWPDCVFKSSGRRSARTCRCRGCGSLETDAHSNLCYQDPGEPMRRRSLSCGQVSARGLNRLRQRDSDAEGENGRSYCERWLVARVTAERRLKRQRRLERRHDDGVHCVSTVPFAAHVLTDERRHRPRYLRAVIVVGHA